MTWSMCRNSSTASVRSEPRNSVAASSAPARPESSRPDSSRRAETLQVELLGCRLAEQVLLDLAGDGHRELIHHDHVARHLEVGDPPRAEGAHGLGVDL